MKKQKLCLFVVFLTFSLLVAEPRNCSTFMLKTDSKILVGHNLDESPELHVPGLVCINKRNAYREGITWFELIASPADFKKSTLPFAEKPYLKIRWTSKYGSITFNSEGMDFPDGGMNEKGLVIFEMSLANTQFKFEPTQPTLFICLWIQYQLDNCISVAEVIRNARKINQQGWSWHYFVTDHTGDCAIIEFQGGEVTVHRAMNVQQEKKAIIPVLCNSLYSKELKRLKTYQGFGGTRKIRFSFMKAPRFVRATQMLKDFDPGIHVSPTRYALDLLDDIKINGWNKWGLLVDVDHRRVLFHTNQNRKLRYLCLADVDFSDREPAQILDIHADLAGDVSAHFVNYNFERNLTHTRERARLLFEKRFKGLIDNGVTAEIYARRFADYSARIRDLNMRQK